MIGYSYLANLPLVSQIFFTNIGALRMTTTKQFDRLNRLSSISSAFSSSSSIGFVYVRLIGTFTFKDIGSGHMNKWPAEITRVELAEKINPPEKTGLTEPRRPSPGRSEPAD